MVHSDLFETNFRFFVNESLLATVNSLRFCKRPVARIKIGDNNRRPFNNIYSMRLLWRWSADSGKKVPIVNSSNPPARFSKAFINARIYLCARHFFTFSA